MGSAAMDRRVESSQAASEIGVSMVSVFSCARRVIKRQCGLQWLRQESGEGQQSVGARAGTLREKERMNYRGNRH